MASDYHPLHTLLQALDTLDPEHVIHALHRCTHINPTPSLLREILQVALGHHGHLQIQWMIIQYVSRSATSIHREYQTLLDDAYLQLAQEGRHPSTICLLQPCISQEMSTYVNRMHLHARKERCNPFYIVSCSEWQTFQDIFNIPRSASAIDMLTAATIPMWKPQRKRGLTATSKLEETLRKQIRINDAFQEAVFCNHRLLFEYILRNHPTATILQQMFARCVLRDENTTMAIMIMESNGIGQQEYDQTFLEAVKTNHISAIQFLLSQHLLYPSICVLDEAFIRLQNTHRLLEAASYQMRDILRARRRQMIKILQPHVSSRAVLFVQQQRERQRWRSLDNHGTGIHEFAETAVSSSSNQNIFQAIREYLEQQVHAFTIQHPHQVMSFRTTDVISVLVQWISNEYCDNADAQIQIVQHALDADAVRLLELTVQYVQYYHPSSHSIWLQGFLEESIEERSCNAGIRQRIITGLRGINDPALNAFFQLAEGPALARSFLTHGVNIMYQDEGDPDSGKKRLRAKMLAQTLVNQFSISCEATAEEIKPCLHLYLTNTVESYGVPIAEFAPSIDTVLETMMDVYEDLLRPLILEELQQQSPLHV